MKSFTTLPAFWIRLAMVTALLLTWWTIPAQETPSPAARGYVLAEDEGEVLTVRDSRVIIKADPKTGSNSVAMGTQRLPPGAGIPIHKHDSSDEVLFLHQGAAVAILGEERTTVNAGATVFVPKGVWHGVESAGEQADIVWVVVPPGLEGFFRDLGVSPDSAAKEFTPQQIQEIANKHGMSVRMP